ncbi:hypothetical protein H2199_007932 [Coniosporium tulheliwenetii]|uniref:Uncharacterized protein n=1 Tax=Coniosporium tulheliwenetii TaxID=3383036 RepID=A0ACC2YLU9_9PEZI|nr:hypothetical protein H2199_007932 [Cladosporium sp. JES 115]
MKFTLIALTASLAALASAAPAPSNLEKRAAPPAGLLSAVKKLATKKLQSRAEEPGASIPVIDIEEREAYTAVLPAPKPNTRKTIIPKPHKRSTDAGFVLCLDGDFQKCEWMPLVDAKCTNVPGRLNDRISSVRPDDKNIGLDKQWICEMYEHANCQGARRVAKFPGLMRLEGFNDVVSSVRCSYTNVLLTAWRE